MKKEKNLNPIPWIFAISALILFIIAFNAFSKGDNDSFLELKASVESRRTGEGSLDYAVFYTKQGERKVILEVADSPDERALGLMFRSSLEEDSGMLFIFDSEVTHPFWMKNTLIPLDIIFIGKTGSVVSIIEDATPCKKDPCDRYYPKKRYNRVIEVKGGWVGDSGVGVGDLVKITNVP